MTEIKFCNRCLTPNSRPRIVFDKKISLLSSNKVFEPNLTTWSLIEACNKLKFRKKKKVLDLGSGSGVIGIYLKKNMVKK